MWRYDANRSGASPDALPGQLHLLWKRGGPPPKPTHPHDVRLCYDLSYEPVASGKSLFVPSMVSDSVTALDTETGLVKWKCFANGPVRFAPIVWQGKVYFGSDDGYLYCVSAEDGRLLWRLRGAADSWREYKLLGGGRLVSRWPALGAPVLADGKVFFAAGFWSNEGVYVCAADAVTGKLLWRNSRGSFAKFGLNDHGGRWYGGISPQGYLAVIAGKLMVPCGRALPAVFDPQTGELEPYSTGWGGRYGLAKGSWWVCGIGKYLFLSGDMFGTSPQSARLSGPKPRGPLAIQEFARLAGLPVEKVRQWVDNKKLKTVTENGRKLIRPFKPDAATYIAWWNSSPTPAEQLALEHRPRLQISPANQKEVGVFREPILTSDAIYYSEPKGFIRSPQEASYVRIVAYDTTRPRRGLAVTDFYGDTPLIVWWTVRFDELWSLETTLKVFIKAGPRLYCGEKGTVAAVDIPKPGRAPRISWKSELQGTPSSMLAADGKLFVVTREGAVYCFGAARSTPAPRRPRAAPSQLTRGDWPRSLDAILQRVPVKHGRCLLLGLGANQLADALVAKSGFPVIALESDPQKVAAQRRAFDSRGLYGKRVQVVQGRIDLDNLPPYFASLVIAEEPSRSGPWSDIRKIKALYRCLRPYGGLACFRFSEEQHAAFTRIVQSAALPAARVRREGNWSCLERTGPLPGAGDWTHPSGGPGNTYSSTDSAVRSPLGMLWYGGALDEIRGSGRYKALVIAAGRMFIAMPDTLYAFDVYTGQLTWKRSIKANGLVAARDCIYIGGGGGLLRIDPATGTTLGQIKIPPDPGASGRETWGNDFRVWREFLVGTTTRNRLVCVGRGDGQVRWAAKCEKDGLHFVLGRGRLYGVDYWRPFHLRRGRPKPRESKIFALDLRTGRQLWRRSVTFPEDKMDPETVKQKPWLRAVDPALSYSAESDVVLLTAVRSTLNAFQGADGALLWKQSIPCKEVPMSFSPIRTPTVLPNSLIAQSGAMYDLHTGRMLSLRFWRGANSGTRGCGRALAGRRILTVRDANASFFDLNTGSQTYLRGIRASCSFNLLPADGLIVSPYASYQCACNYGIRTSFALAHMPELAHLRRVASLGAEKRLRLSANPGGTVQFRVFVRNWAAARVADRIHAKPPPGWRIDPVQQRVELPGNGAAEYRFTVHVAPEAKLQWYTVTLRAVSPELALDPVRVRIFITRAIIAQHPILPASSSPGIK